MNEKFIIVKINEEALKQPIDFLEQSFIHGETRLYNILNATDINIVSKFNGLNCKAVFVIFRPNIKEQKDDVLCLYIGQGKIEKRNNWTINYQIKEKKTSELIVHNFISSSELDLKNDFGSHSYISIESSKEVIRQLNFIIDDPYVVQKKVKKEQKYCAINIEDKLSPYSQLNQHCIRPVGIIQPQEGRGEFQRDYERIVHSKAFRRLVDKAQIFTSSKGDYYRTRMTHTLEVAQISRAIAVKLNLNINLTEAIALAHDLGHTPFGHQGERTLDGILKNNIKIIKDANESGNPFGGFKHNFQGLRVVNLLEEKYIEFEGLDLSYQVLEGILKHTGGRIKNCKACTDSKQCKSKCFDLEEFLPGVDADYIYPKIDHVTTLEGQIVAIADEIAQRSHDLDDSFSSNLIDYQELLEYLELSKMKVLHDKIARLNKDIEEALKKNRLFVDVNELRYSRVVSVVVGFFINDVVKQSEKKIKEFQKNENDFYKDDHRFSELLIDFSIEGRILNDYLQKIISKKVINSLDVSRFDNKAEMIVEALFKAYYNNSKLLHKGTLQRISIEMRKVSSEVIDFTNGDNELIKEEFKKIKTIDIGVDEMTRTPEQKEYWQKRKILVRNIVDYISGMTDNYALNEYNLIYF